MTMFDERDTQLKLVSKNKNQTMSAPWCLTGQGEPLQLSVPASAKACCDLKNRFMHVRDSERGIARTSTPSAWVLIDHDEGFFELEFINLEDPTDTLASVFISEGRLHFDDKNRFAFSNTHMFESFCRILASPEFNPWSVMPPINNDHALYQCNLRESEIWLNPEINGVEHVDEIRSEFVSLSFQTTEPTPCWNKDTREDDHLAPGTYHQAKVIKADHDTGAVQTIRVDDLIGDSPTFNTYHIDFPPLAQKILDGDVLAGNFVERVNFDPRVHTDMAMSAAAAAAQPKGFWGKLFT